MTSSHNTHAPVRALVQPMAAGDDPRGQQCSNAVDAKFYWQHPQGLYEYWYQRAARDGSQRGELRVRIAEKAMSHFLTARNLSSKFRTEQFVNVTRGANGWYLVTGALLTEWDEKYGVFHDTLGVWLREFNLFFNEGVTYTGRAHMEYVAKPKRDGRVVVNPSGKITLRSTASEAKLQQLSCRFSVR